MAETLYDFYESMIQSSRSVMLSTLSQEGIPNASYAPFVTDEEGCFYINISGMARHTVNLRDTGKVSVLLVEDESVSENIFARKRITFTCHAEMVERESERWESVHEKLELRFGEGVRMYRQMEDFRIFALKPLKGLVVMGFGAAYPFEGAIPQGKILKSNGGGSNPHAKDTLLR